MQERREFRVVVPMGLMGDERVGLQHSFESLASLTSLVSDFGEMCEVSGDLRTTVEYTSMADPPPYPDPKGDADRDTGTPRWVKVFGIIGLVLVLLFVILLFTGRSHGPGRHTSSGGTGGNTPASSVIESGGPGGYAPPEGGH